MYTLPEFGDDQSRQGQPRRLVDGRQHQMSAAPRNFLPDLRRSTSKSALVFVVLVIGLISCVTPANADSSVAERNSSQTLASTGKNSLVVYPHHKSAISRSDSYTIDVVQDGRTVPLFVYQVKPGPQETGGYNGADWYRSRGISFSFATFSYEGRVTVRVKKLTGRYGDVTVRPARLGVIARLENQNTAVFELNRSGDMAGQKISIEFDGLTKDRLLLFADPLEKPERLPVSDAPETQIVGPGENFQFSPGKNTVIFEPGLHDVGYQSVPGHVRHIYLSGGAYVRGAFNFDGRNNALINGRGVLSGERFRYQECRLAPAKQCGERSWLDAVHLLRFRDTNGFHLEGLTLVKPPHYATNSWGAQNARLENFKIVGSFRHQEDGIEVSTNARVNDCFINAMDDSFKMYFSGATVNNCVVWQGINGAVFQYGWYNKNASGNTVSDIDVIHADWIWGKGHPQSDTKSNNNAVFGYMPGSNSEGRISNETYRRIRVETPVLRVFGFRVPKGQVISSILFEDISIAGLLPDPRWTANYFIADGGTIENLKFSRISVEGKQLTINNVLGIGQFEFTGTKPDFLH